MTRKREEQSCLFLLQREILKRPMSAYDAAEFLKITVRNARPYMKLLVGVRIARWINRGRGPWVAVYEEGTDPDAPKPDKKQYLNRRKVRKVMKNPLKNLARML